MRVGTLTFHWASNYGAILQSYALQTYLSNQGVQAEIIDYVPRNVVAAQFRQRLKKLDLSDMVREWKMRTFRRKHLVLSPKTYHSRNDLQNLPGDYDAIVCGSDQIWNEWFTLNAEGGPTRSYLLDFAPLEVKRVSYAASFGLDQLSDQLAAIVQPELAKFQSIGVREESAAAIVKSLGLTAQVVVDPTLLLTADSYQRLIGEHTPRHTYRFFSFLLHGNQPVAEQARKYVSESRFPGEDLYDRGSVSVIDWLCHVRNAEFVLTNSFHGAVFCLIFRRPFVVVPVEGPGHAMNGRFETLLKAVGLEDRMLREYSEARIDALAGLPIDWHAVDEALDKMRESSAEFLGSALGVQTTMPGAAET